MDVPRHDDPPALDLSGLERPLPPAAVLASRIGLGLLGGATALVILLGW